MTAITFALPEESGGLAGLLSHSGEIQIGSCTALLGNLGSEEVLIFHTGMGAVRARGRVSCLLENHPVRRLISAGYAGGLDPALAAGSLLLGQNYSHQGWLAKAAASLGESARTGILATAPQMLETPDEKARFARETGADAVDMETAVIDALCREYGVPMLSLRAISDTAMEELAVPFSTCFDTVSERARPAALLSFLLRNPSRAGGFAQFIMRIGRVRKTLSGALERLIKSDLPCHG